MKIDELLIDFDEMGFAPAILCENPEEYAREWKRQLVAEIERLKAVNEKLLDSVESVQAGRCCLRCELTKQAVRELADRVKMAFYYEFDEIIPSIISDKIDELLKEYEK